MSRHWTQDEIRWLNANVDRMDLPSVSRALGVPLVEVERKLAELRAATAAGQRKPPATHREAAERFGVSAASVSRWRNLQLRQGDVRPGPLGGDRNSH